MSNPGAAVPVEEPMELTVPLETLAFIIIKARERSAEVPPVDEDPGSDPADDGEREILEDRRDNPTDAELRGVLAALNRDEMDEVVALTWLGRGDFTKDEWPAALAEAKDRHNGREADYLLGTPLLGDYLEEALSQLDLSIEEFEIGRM
jgi:hypothetical protein